MARRTIKEIELGTKEVFDIEDEYARNTLAREVSAINNKIDGYHYPKKWFYVVDSYGVSSVTDDPFPTKLKNNGYIVDELSVGMMSYSGSAVNVIPQLNNKLSGMSQATINSITDVVCTLGLNDTWDNYNLIRLHTSVESFIDYIIAHFPNVKQIHLAPIGNEIDTSSDDENQANRMKMVQHVIKKCVSYNNKVVFVNNSQIAMNCPAYFMNDNVHPNSEGSRMLYDNFINYMRTGEFPINTWSYFHPLDAFGWRYRMEYVGNTCSGEFQWDSTISPFNVVGTDDFNIIFSGGVDLPLMRKLQLNPSLVVSDTGSGFKRGLLGLIGLSPNTPTQSGLILSGHGNTGGSSPETYNHVKFFQSFSYTI